MLKVLYHLQGVTVWVIVWANGRQKPRTESQMRFTVFHLPELLGRPGTELSSQVNQRKAWNWWREANGKHTFRRSEIPFGNFGLPFKKSHFPREISVRKKEIVFPITFHPKFPVFMGKCKQPKSPASFRKDII